MRSVLGNRGKNVLYICINNWSQPLIKVFYFTHDNFCFKFSWCTFNIRYCKWGHQLLENLNLKSESEILTPILQSILNEMFSQPMGGTCQLIKKHCNNLNLWHANCYNGCQTSNVWQQNMWHSCKQRLWWKQQTKIAFTMHVRTFNRFQIAFTGSMQRK